MRKINRFLTLEDVFENVILRFYPELKVKKFNLRSEQDYYVLVVKKINLAHYFLKLTVVIGKKHGNR